MKKQALCLIALVFSLAFTVHAVEDCWAYGAVNKITRGCVNIVTGWTELPLQTYYGYEEGVDYGVVNLRENPAASRSLGTIIGLGRGIGHALGRTVWGVVDVVTFWAKAPTDDPDSQLLLDREYVWNERKPVNFSEPTIKAGARKIGYRATRGVDEIFFSLPEIPCQTQLYWEKYGNETFALGILNGVWLAGSRIFNGAADLLFCWLPGYESSLQIPYDENHQYALCEQYSRNLPKVKEETKKADEQKAIEDKAAAEKKALEKKAAAEKKAADKIAAEKAAREKKAARKVAKEKAAADKIAAEKAAAEKKAADKKAAEEKKAAEKAAKEKKEAEKKLAAEKKAAEKKLAEEKKAAEKAAKEKAAAEKKAAEKAAKEKKEAEKKKAAEMKAAAKKEAEAKAAQEKKAAAERKAAEKAEKARIEAEKKAAKAAAKKAAEEKKAAEKAEKARIEAEKKAAKEAAKKAKEQAK